ncbi:hypothetical protein D3C83_78390 [compost metagenome]
MKSDEGGDAELSENAEIEENPASRDIAEKAPPEVEMNDVRCERNSQHRDPPSDSRQRILAGTDAQVTIYRVTKPLRKIDES